MPTLVPQPMILPLVQQLMQPAPQVDIAPDLKQYPSEDDAKFARSQGFGYGTPAESYIEGRGVRMLNQSGSGRALHDVASAAGDPNQSHMFTSDQPSDLIGNLFARGALAANHIPIASLGFDPHHMGLEPDPRGNWNIGGLYTPSSDSMYVNDQLDRDPSAMVHESIHRGLNMLRQDPSLKDTFNNLPDEESVVRYLMATKAGDPERGQGDAGDKQIEAAMTKFEFPLAGSIFKSAVNDLTKAAQDKIAKQRPMGPR